MLEGLVSYFLTQDAMRSVGVDSSNVPERHYYPWSGILEFMTTDNRPRLVILEDKTALTAAHEIHSKLKVANMLAR